MYLCIYVGVFVLGVSEHNLIYLFPVPSHLPFAVLPQIIGPAANRS